MKHTVTLYNAQQGHAEMRNLWEFLKPWLIAGYRFTGTFRTSTRSLAQNNLMWSCLGDLSKQVEWFGRRLSDEGWKEFITAHIAGQEVLPNMDGDGFVTIGRGKSTSDMTIAEMTEVIDRCHAFGDLRGVKWRPTSLGRGLPDEVAA